MAENGLMSSVPMNLFEPSEKVFIHIQRPLKNGFAAAQKSFSPLNG